MQSWALPNFQQVVDRAVRLKDDLEKTINDQSGEPGSDLVLLPTTDDTTISTITTTAILPSSNPPETTTEPTIINNNDQQSLLSESGIPSTNTATSVIELEPPPTIDITSQVENQPESTIDTTTTTISPSDTSNNNNTESTNVDSSSSNEQQLTSTSTPPPNYPKLLHEREQQLENLSRRLAEQEKELQLLKEKNNNDGNISVITRRAILAEQKAEALLKEGMMLSEKEGKAQQQLRKVRKEKESLEVLLQEKDDALKKSETLNTTLLAENRELKEVSKRGEESILHITTSGAEASRKLEQAMAQVQTVEKRESELKYALERSMSEAAEAKKQIASLTHELAASKRREENAQFQLREQLDTKQVQGSRAETMERMLSDVKAALEDQLKEARKTETDLRLELGRALEAKKQAELRVDQLSKLSIDSTTPLLRQIDTLQKLREKNESVLTTLSARAVAAEANEAELIQARRKSETARSELAIRVAELEAALASGKAELSHALSEAKLANKRAEEIENERETLLEQMDKARNISENKLQELRSIEMQLRQNLALEHDKIERLRREYEEKIRDVTEKFHVELTKQQQQQHLIRTNNMGNNNSGGEGNDNTADSGGGTTNTTMTRFNSHGSSNNNNTGGAVGRDSPSLSSLMEDDFLTQDAILSSALVGFTPNSGPGGSILKLSDLESGIRRRDLRIKALMDQLHHEIQRREALSKELTELTEKYHALQSSTEMVEQINNQMKKLTRENQVLLEMLGESEERYEELKSDFEDVKIKFREQVDQLLAMNSGNNNNNSTVSSSSSTSGMMAT
jgi:hypothetical protein